MQILVLSMLLAVTAVPFLVSGDDWGRWSILPSQLKLLPEVLSGIAVLCVVVGSVSSRFRFVRTQYWLLFAAIVVVMACGALVNHVGTGPLTNGIRTYVRAVVWFLVPAVFAFSDSQLRLQLKVILIIGLLQLPLAIQQRLSTKSEGRFTGDYTTGTLMISSVMSVFLIGCVCISVALLIRKKISIQQFLMLFVLLLTPTTLNETKGTLVLLPVSLLIAALAAAPRGRRARMAVFASVMVVAFGAVFVPVYDYFNSMRPYAEPISEKFTSIENLEKYVWKTDDIGSADKPGRVDSIVVPIRRMSMDISRLAFGFGLGNVSNSALGRQFTGEYFRVYGPYLTTGFGRILLELGVIGVCLVASLMWLTFRDSLRVSTERTGMISDFAAGWAGVAVLIGLSLLYKDLIVHESVSYLFWYFSGVIAAERMRYALSPGKSGATVASSEQPFSSQSRRLLSGEPSRVARSVD